MGMAGPEADEPRSGAPAVPVTDAAARLRRRVRVLRALIIVLVTLLAVLLAVSVATRGTDGGDRDPKRNHHGDRTGGISEAGREGQRAGLHEGQQRRGLR